jgi:cation:H+ antiporter
LSRLDGALMLAIGAVYTVVLIWKSRSELRSVKADYKEMFGPDGARSQGTGETRKSVNAVFLLAGLILSVIGANLLVGGAVSIARNAGISEAVIGLTIVAVGTSAPELVTTIVGTLRNERDVAVGNLIGSSIYNILLILGISCLLAPAGLLVERHLLLFDIPLMTAVAILCIPVFITGKKVSRTEGGIFVTVYLVYLGYLVFLR